MELNQWRLSDFARIGLPAHFDDGPNGMLPEQELARACDSSIMNT
jgi:hypothetical protein